MESQDRNNLTLAKIKEAMAKVKQPPGPIAFVFPIRLQAAVMAYFERSQGSDIRVHLQSGVSTPNLAGMEVYFDHEQQIECLAFYDREGLRLYLNRMNDPTAWLKYLEDQYRPLSSWRMEKPKS